MLRLTGTEVHVVRRRVGEPSSHPTAPLDRSSLDETHEPPPADPLARPDLSGDVVASAELDPVQKSAPGRVLVWHLADATGSC